MAATSPLRPSTPARPILNAPQLSPSRMPPPFASQSSYKSGHRGLDMFSPVDQNGSFCFDRVIKSGKVHRRVKNKGAWKPSWKQAYLVLRPNLLSVYQNPDETDLKASITLSEVTAVARVRKAHTDHVFGVFSPSKNYHFQGASEADTEDWIAHIRLESRMDEDDGLDLKAPQFSSKHPDQSNTYESTDISADEMHRAPGSPEGHSAATQNRTRTGSLLASRQRAHSTLQEYSGNEQFTTSHSDFSDTLSSSLPKHSSTSLSKQPVLTPIASSGHLTEKLNPTATTTFTQPPPPTHSDLAGTTDPERVVRQGHLQILKSHKTGVKGWKSIWVVLRPRSLSFYKNGAEYAAVKILPMHTIVNAAEIDPISRSKSFCFQIITDDKTYRFCAPDEEELDRWLGAIKSVLARRNEAEKAAVAKAMEKELQKEKGKGKDKGIVEASANLTLRATPQAV
ncbi:PH domain protein [Cladophialophora carrionii]|uniref:PH domain protein n=1 Tax=Cladophialophora carrionii TaxID=86049 RepID=A0A1C1C8W6_9EURO|nr:PH domain protein [Cladophialophora carrionii]